MAPTRGPSPSRSTRASTMRPSSTSAARVSPIPASMIHSVKRHAGRTEQRAGFKDRQPDDIRIAARQNAHETYSTHRDRLAPRPAPPPDHLPTHPQPAHLAPL